ncbi:MAG: SDR family NAD(P)-dependent oxidoreductase [Bacteroidales bacterium]|jgi:NAD(P)-dependent dehydrogenase (short-subunit alcohol dehydrogenase family)|nr:SDR family NAD(P)-dependent oxidoreductase [Bacteroidales bacterium]
MKAGIITGADGGIGQQLTRALAKQEYSVVMGCRNIQKGNKICEQIKQQTDWAFIEVIEIDLSSFSSICRFVSDVYSKYNQLDILLNNAGVLCHRPQMTKENVEFTIGVNYLGHYLLTERLFPLMSSGTRIINTLSLLFRYGKIGHDFLSFNCSRFNRFRYYANSKLALYYATLDWAEKWNKKGITVNCVDPGIVNTNIIRSGNKVIDKLCDLFFRPLIRTSQQGADTIIYLATNDEFQHVTGQLFKDRKLRQLSSLLNNQVQRELLKQQTENFIDKHRDY